jgi:sortase A
MTNQGILFSPLKQVALGDKIYLTDMKQVFTYQVTTKKTINETQVQWIDDVPGKKLVTLITCASPTEGEVNRIAVQGDLIKVSVANKQELAVFN